MTSPTEPTPPDADPTGPTGATDVAAGARPSGHVVVVGSLNVDLVTRVAGHPRPGETVAGDPLRRLAGGKGANQALAAVRAGASTRLLGCVGDDADGEALVHGLALRGVDVSGVRRVDSVPTGTALIAVDPQGEATIVVSAGANGEVGVADVELNGAHVLLLQLEVPSAVVSAAARRAAASGVRVVFNPSPYSASAAEVLDLADPVVVNRHEAAQLTSRPRSLVTTMGPDGARWETAGGEVLEVAAPTVRAVDRTGAGDAFAGTLAAALAAGRSEREALEAAVSAGAEAVTAHGAQGWTIS